MGDPVAMLSIGYFYDVGVGGRRDRNIAMHWYKRAWRRGHPSAANNIGTVYRDSKDYKRAFAWFNEAVEMGEVGANFEIACVYMDHLDEPERALPYLRLVAKAQPGVDVTEWEWERARLLLDGMAAQKKRKHKRASRPGRMRVVDTRKT